LDNHTIILNDEKITSRYFILAMGSSPAIPPIEGIENVPYITNVEIFYLDKLPGSMIVLGGGPIGMEMAQAFTRLGSKVTVVEYSPHVLNREDEDISRFVEERLREEGVRIFLQTKAVKAEYKDGQVELRIEQNNTTSVLEAESILVATGRKPNIEGLGLEKAGVEYDKRCVKADERLRTTARNIFACGDINGRFLFTHVASYEAVVAVYNAILKIPKKADYTNVPWCTYLDPEVASIGYNEKRAKEARIRYKVQVEHLVENDRALAEGETKGFIKILIGPKGKAIGIQIVGFHAGDLIHEWVPVLNGKVRLATVSDAIHVYPTMAEINKNATVHYLVSTIPPWTKKLTKILFGYQGKA
jgi:pyruvate/2-oxoglutarate dehydrogenase complex dihydrolipoamide dehydrogenase (E3) component